MSYEINPVNATAYYRFKSSFVVAAFVINRKQLSHLSRGQAHGVKRVSVGRRSMGGNSFLDAMITKEKHIFIIMPFEDRTEAGS